MTLDQHSCMLWLPSLSWKSNN